MAVGHPSPLFAVLSTHCHLWGRVISPGHWVCYTLYLPCCTVLLFCAEAVEDAEDRQPLLTAPMNATYPRGLRAASCEPPCCCYLGIRPAVQVPGPGPFVSLCSFLVRDNVSHAAQAPTPGGPWYVCVCACLALLCTVQLAPVRFHGRDSSIRAELVPFRQPWRSFSLG
ncbi:uncharacterized protein LY79DRAFT_537453 [Colletotrichum navitas]|uniref:Uncharacterized protein n=1 Tax=Colletotrichum navitas TaxID=681940 RepID=A0AAD8Q9S3_9PEZI|nr:uncharacterized protein LY79DRAFT_537453 [Colletotrichum navitas]KAK1598552.1 hypothetical protein LY79DRAFT_537453 [Colletotrichum navitas]